MDATLIAQLDPIGVGLAANQVGLDLALFIMKPTPKAPTEVIINPKIIELEPTTMRTQEQMEEDEDVPLEGCLSIPKIWSPVNRSQKILLEFTDLKNQVKQKWFTGFKAVIVQHEMDHLNGILFTQRSLEQNMKLYEEKNGKLIERKV